TWPSIYLARSSPPEDAPTPVGATFGIAALLPQADRIVRRRHLIGLGGLWSFGEGAVNVGSGTKPRCDSSTGRSARSVGPRSAGILPAVARLKSAAAAFTRRPDARISTRCHRRADGPFDQALPTRNLQIRLLPPEARVAPR